MDDIWRHIVWAACAIVVFIIFCIVFKDKLVSISFDPRNRKFKALFKQRINQAKSQAKKVQKTVESSGLATASRQAIDFSKQTSRDVVIEAFGALKQIVYSACIKSGIPLTPSTRISAAVERLLDINAIDNDVADLIEHLNTMGQDVVDATSRLPMDDDARSYRDLSDNVIDWMMLNILPLPEPSSDDETSPEPVHSRTAVGHYYQHPSTEHPAAQLVGISGSVRGMRFPIDKESISIGSNAENAICIRGDGYVSGHHAAIRYEKGSLFLFDDDSRNGTYLNENRITKGAAMIKHGDRIRLGESVFEVSSN